MVQVVKEGRQHAGDGNDGANERSDFTSSSPLPSPVRHVIDCATQLLTITACYSRCAGDPEVRYFIQSTPNPGGFHGPRPLRHVEEV